ncbi:F-box/FBD/LRR-repeat protein At1g13570 [Linum perenne]
MQRIIKRHLLFAGESLLSKMARRRSTDRISSLPDDVRERILMFLPLREAAKSSILSSKWRNLWTNLPTLVIDESFGDEIAARESKDSPKVGKLIMLEVCRVLMLHHGPLRNFTLSLDKWGTQVDQILQFLPYNTLQSLTIKSIVDERRVSILSKAVFTSFSQLKTLRLSCCEFTSSTVSFEGFNRLTVLELRNVVFTRGIEPQLSFRCPLLATLILVNCFPNPYIAIVIEEAPVLECLYLVGIRSIHFEFLRCSLFLKHVVIRESCSTFLHLYESFSTVESLSIRKISEFITPTKQWVKLRHLNLDGLWINTPNGMLFVIRWIMNSPNLQRLEIRLKEKICLKHATENSDDEAELGDVASEYEECRLLTKVEVKNIRGSLETITRVWNGDDQALRIMKSGVAVSNHEQRRMLLTMVELKMVREESLLIKMARSRRRSADRISNLPDDVMERILMFLPLKDAAKSSILSTKWRYLWTNLPTLVIDESFVDEIAAQRSEDTEDEVVGKLILLDVCRVLMLHRGPLINFSLSLHKWGNQVDQILRFLPYNTLQSLTIQHFNQLNFWHLSKTVFTSFSQLKTLRLSRCYFRFSSISFEGFDRLTVLELRSVMVIRRIQPQLSLRCPLLATLILVSCFSTSRIVVEEAPILECLHLDGGNVTLRHCSPFLKSVVIREIISKFLHQSESFSSTVESLSIRGILKLTTPMKQWVKLRQLSLGGLWRNINTRTEVLFVICWIMNSPNLESVAICSDKKFGLERVTENSDDGAELGDDAYNYGGSRLLRKVEVKTIRGTKNEMSLLRWLLNSSPALDQMEIQLSSALSDAEKVSFLIELNGLQRASSKARIIIHHYSRENEKMSF